MFEALRLNAEEVATASEAMRVRTQALTPELKKLYFKRYKEKIKDPDTYAVLNWFFLAGLHHMYLEKYLRGSLNLVLLILGIVLLFSPMQLVGVLLVGFILCLELMALFRSQIIVADHNNKVAATLLDEFEQG